MIKNISYFDYVINLLKEIKDAEMSNIDKSSNMIADAIENKKSIFAFGASHAGIITEELFYRAGGLAVVNPILESSVMLNTRPVTFTSSMERLLGYGTEIAKKTPIKKGDVIICHSVSGRNAIMLDFVIEAKSKGAKIIGITNVKYSKSVDARHPGGKKLYELSDIVIDNHGEIGDACIDIEGIEQKVAPSSTVAGATIVNSIICGVAEKLAQKGGVVPIFYSANLDGGDEKNKEIFDKFKDNIFFM